MNKLEFTDLYRFLVSLGIVLIALSVLVPWLFLHETFDTTLEASEISKLTETAQILITSRQNIALWFLQNMLWISITLAAAGLVLSLTGSVFWIRKQITADHLDYLSLQKTELDVERIWRELEPLDPMQIVQKSIEKSDPDTCEKADLEEYIRIETLFLEKLISCYGQDRILIQQRIQQATLDAVLIGRHLNADIIFDIRTLAQLNPHRIKQIIAQGIKLTSIYESVTGNTVIGVPVCIVGKGLSLEDVRQSFESILQAQPQSSGKLSPLYIQEDHLRQISCSELKKEIQSSIS